MKDREQLWEVIYKNARSAARHASKNSRYLVPVDDLFQNLTLWAMEHWSKIEEWEAEDSLPFKLRKTFANESQKYVMKQRVFKSKVPVSDYFFYTPEVLHELLRDVWEYEGWSGSSDMTTEFIAKSSKPAEGNNRLALMADVKFALEGLNENDRNLLRQRYADGGMEFDALAAFYDLNEDALRKRVKRAIKKLQDRLGGEAPVWTRRRHRKSNAQAQAETNSNE